MSVTVGYRLGEDALTATQCFPVYRGTPWDRCTESRGNDLVSFAELRGCPQVLVCARGALAAVHINKSYSVDVGAISAVPEEAGG